MQNSTHSVENQDPAPALNDSLTNTITIQESTPLLPQAQTQPQPTPSTPTPTMPLFYTLSTIFGASSVILGAFGAHGLKKRITDPSRLTNWSTAAQYQLIHSAVLLTMSLTLPKRSQRVPGALLVAGMTMFSGSIYLLVLDPKRFGVLGPVTPLGGLCLIGGWVALGVVGRRAVALR